jgi:hypothetical protein
MISMRVPMPMPELRILPAWWAVTRRMVAPDSDTGSTSSTGVILPVRPTCHWMPVTVVRAVSPLVLTAICQR